MLKCIKIDRLPDDLQIRYISYHTLAGLKMKIELEFDETCDGLEEGPTYIVAKVSDDCLDDVNLSNVAFIGINVAAYCYVPKVSINTELLGDRRETTIGRKGENLLHKRGSKFKLIAPAPVMFKKPEIPKGFKGEVHKFEDKIYMCKVMYSDFGIEEFLNLVEPGVYYICAVLCEDFEGPITYDYFVNCLKYDKLTAYKLEE